MKHTLFILALITASIQTFAQSPRIKLNQITKDSVTGSVLVSSPTDSGMVYSRDLYISYGADTVLILNGDTLAATSGIISSVLSDGVTIIGNGTTGNELTADTSVLATLRALSDSLVNYVSTTELSDSTSNIRTDIPLIISDSLLNYVSRTELSDSLALVSGSVTADGVTITGDGTVGSPLKVDTTTYIATKQDLDAKQDQLNGTGFVKATGTTISYDNSTYLTSEVDGDVSNELQTLSYNSSTNEITLSDGGGTEDLSNLDLVDSTRINATGDTAYYYQNGVLIGTGPIAGGGGGTTYNNITETVDTLYVKKYLDVDTSTLYVDAVNNRVGIGTVNGKAPLNIYGNINVLDPSTTSGTDANFYIYENGMTSTGPTDSEFWMQVAGPNSSGVSDGPLFIMRGNNHGRFSGTEKGAIFFQSGSITSPTDKQGSVFFTAPTGFIDLTTINASTSRLRVENDGDVVIPRVYSNTTGTAANVNVDATGLLRRSTSSIRYKTNIKEYDKGVSDVMNLNPVYYQGINDGDNVYVGFIAEQVDEIGLSEFIQYDLEGRADAISYSNMTALLTKAIQEQQAIIDQQATEIEMLKSQIQLILNEIEQLKNN